MSRPALWPAAPVAVGCDSKDEGPTTRAPSLNGATVNEPPETPIIAEIRAHGATGREVGAALERIAGLHEQLAQAHRELSKILQNELAGERETRLMSSVKAPQRLLSVRDVAQRLDLSKRTVRRMRQRGQLPRGAKLGGVIRWRAEDIDAFVAAGGRG